MRTGFFIFLLAVTGMLMTSTAALAVELKTVTTVSGQDDL